MSIPETVEHVTFEDGDLVWKVYARTTFTECTFKGVAKHCDFGDATFVDCAFDPQFRLVDCNIGGAEGLPEAFHAPPRRCAVEANPPLRLRGPRFPGELP